MSSDNVRYIWGKRTWLLHVLYTLPNAYYRVYCDPPMWLATLRNSTSYETYTNFGVATLCGHPTCRTMRTMRRIRDVSNNLFVSSSVCPPTRPPMSGPDCWAHLLCVYVQVPLCVCACVWIKIVIRRVSLGNFFSCFDWFVIYCRCLRFAYSLFTLTISLLLLLAPLVLLLLRWVFDFDF